MQKFTVVGFYEGNGQIFSHQVEATSSQNAFFTVAEEHPEATLIASLDDHIKEGQGITFAGDSIVDAETVLSQPEVFNV